LQNYSLSKQNFAKSTTWWFAVEDNLVSYVLTLCWNSS